MSKAMSYIKEQVGNKIKNGSQLQGYKIIDSFMRNSNSPIVNIQQLESHIRREIKPNINGADLAYDIIGLHLVYDYFLDRRAYDYLFNQMSGLINISALSKTSLSLLAAAKEQGFNKVGVDPNKDITYTFATQNDLSQEKLAVLVKDICLITGKSEYEITMVDKKTAVEYKYYSLLSLSDLTNLHDNNIFIEEKYIHNPEIKNQFAFMKKQRENANHIDSENKPKTPGLK
ncbi:hypothetical protein [Pantoea agglomerans]|uniref:hypothetical protein n=1 Tax=Enterobacter agglomerans TaxID=549 RepID=UPI003C7B6CEC